MKLNFDASNNANGTTAGWIIRNMNGHLCFVATRNLDAASIVLAEYNGLRDGCFFFLVSIVFDALDNFPRKNIDNFFMYF